MSFLNHSLVIFGVLSLFYQYQPALGAMGLAACFFFMLPYSFFYATRMKACQVWMVYASITQRQATFRDAAEVAGKQKWTIRLFAVLKLLIASSSSNKDSGFFSRLFLSALETVLDVADDYLLPATVIEQKSIRETVGKLEQLKTNIPASLTGAFAFDLFSGAISSLLALVHIAIWAVGAVVGFLLAPWISQALVTTLPLAMTQNLAFLPHHIFMAPLILSFGISSLLSRTMTIATSSLKNVYFSVFYVSINRPLEIREELRESLTHYLRLEDLSYSQAIKNQFSEKFATLAKGPAPFRKTDAQGLQLVEKIFKENVATGHSLQMISDFLRKKGYPEDQIQLVLEKYKRSA